MENLDIQMEYQTNDKVEHEQLTILVVDGRETSSVLERHIIRLGHTVIIAESYSEALQMISMARFDLIIIDIDLPVGDEDEIISKIRELAGDLNIVAMTNKNNRTKEQRIREQYILYYAVSPLDYYEITSVIDHLVLKKANKMET